MSKLETELYSQLLVLKVPIPVREHRFAAHHVGLGKGVRLRLVEAGLKDWRFDLSWPDLMFAVEVEGGGWIGGRHTRGSGFQADMEKYHHAMRLGWDVYRCDGALIKNGEAVQLIADILRNRSVDN